MSTPDTPEKIAIVRKLAMIDKINWVLTAIAIIGAGGLYSGYLDESLALVVCGSASAIWGALLIYGRRLRGRYFALSVASSMAENCGPVKITYRTEKK